MVRDELSPARAGLLELLETHFRRATDPHERAMVQATLDFVRAHPDCAERTLAPGHLTGSAWILDPARKRVLLTHHRKLEKWLQLGGHADGDLDLRRVALREAQEESGLARFEFLSPDVFDVDRHWIPPRKADPGHWHYDVRFLLKADSSEPLVSSEESMALAWVDLDRIGELSVEESLARMARKSASYL